MSSHFYRMATMDRIGCGRPAVDGTDFTWNIDEVTCGNCKRSKAFKAAVADREHRTGVLNSERVTDSSGQIGKIVAVCGDTYHATTVKVAWGMDADIVPHYAIQTATDYLISELSPVTEADRQAVSEWRNGPRVIEYATTEEAYDAAMSDDTITDSTVLMVRTEGVVGVLMNAWPVAVTAANGQFHHTINPPASGTDPSWDKAVSLAVALGFPLQFAERPALMDRIRSLGNTVRSDMKIHTAENHEGALMAWGITTPGDNCSNPRMATCVVCRPELIAEDVETSAPFRTRSKVKNTRQARRFRKGA